MKIKKLDIVGFKSFAEKTTVTFPQGISAVVGPNGCGKSNIVDAIRWVMGEQSVKQLRGKSMEDVIFAGSEKTPPHNVAEVAVTLVNENGSAPERYREFSEIMVSRRLFRSGESGYFINKEPCRLKDVQELLMGTGVGTRSYAVIEQGRISSLIDAGPEHRRYFIEEAAGITRYKSRKNEALGKMERTQQNMVRLNDVISEISRQMNTLQRQARKAERYKRYRLKIEDLEVQLAAYRYRDISRSMEETSGLLQSLRDTDFQHAAELAKLDAAIETVKVERTAKHEHISTKKSEKYEMQRTIDRLEGEIDFRTKDLQRLTNDAGRILKELEEIEEKNRGVAEECQELATRREALEKGIEEIRASVKEAQEEERARKEELARLNRAMESRKAELMSLASRKATYVNTLENATRQKSNLSRRLDQLAQEKLETQDVMSGLEEELAKTREENEGLTGNLKELAGTVQSLESRLQESRQALGQQVREVQTMEAERQKIKSRYSALKRMDENYEWFSTGVRQLMTRWKSQQREHVHGLVAEVIEPEPTYETAVEAALGEALQYVIVDDQDTGRAGIDFLRQESAGRSGFIPMTGLKAMGDHLDSATSGHEPLMGHMKIKSGYEPLVRSLLGHVSVVDDCISALNLWRQNGLRRTVVTRDGDRICPQGIVTGGTPEKAGPGILAKKSEVRSLAEGMSKLEGDIALAVAKQRSLEDETVSLETNKQKIKETRRQLQEQQIQVEKTLYRLQEKCNHARERLEILELEAQHIQGEQSDVEEELSRHQEVLSELTMEMRSAEQAIGQTNGKIDAASRQMEEANEKLVGQRLRSTSLQAEHESCQNTLRRLEEFREDRQRQLAQLARGLQRNEDEKNETTGRLAEDRSRMGHLYTELKALDKALEESEMEYAVIEQLLEQNDRSLGEMRTAREETAQKIQQLELKQSERRITREHLVSRIEESYHQDIRTAGGEIDLEGFSEEAAEKALSEHRERIGTIGEVNLGAIQEYEALSERHRLLTEQTEDLQKAIEDLHRVIRKINRTSLKRFMKTFKTVNEKLQVVFNRLFQGGMAKLVLVDPRHPLESGVSFMVQPPGKKVTHMSLLSGGEKAMSALALVFSLFLIKPSAFCVLDEIDAPLDEANVGRFSDLLIEIGQASQIIMITHNKQSMEMAEALFGVTMENKGVSKLVSLDFIRQ